MLPKKPAPERPKPPNPQKYKVNSSKVTPESLPTTVSGSNGYQSIETPNSAVETEFGTAKNLTIDAELTNEDYSQIKSTSKKPSNSFSKSEETQNLLKGLSIAFIGAGVSYGVQSVLVSVATQNGITPFLLLFIRSSFQSCAFFIMLKFNILTTKSTKNPSLLPPIEHLPYILSIVTCYFFATASSFVSFSLIPPGAGIGTRGAARALAALGLTYLFLQEDLSYSKSKKYDNWKNKLLQNKFVDVFIGAICLTGIGLVVKSIPAQLCSLTSEEYGIELNDVKTVGYLLAVFAGLSRAVGMCLYRNKRDIEGSITGRKI